MTIVHSALALSAIAAFCYGIGGPLVKHAGTVGATLPTLGISYAIGVLVATGAATYIYGAPATPFGTSAGIRWAGLTGLIFGIAYVAAIKAFELPDGHVSIVSILIAGYPILSSAIAIAFLGEASKVNLWYVIPGTMMTVGGVVLVGLGSK